MKGCKPKQLVRLSSFGMVVFVRWSASKPWQLSTNRKMNGEQFVDTLKELGYPSTENLDPQMFNWMFENDAVSPFLHWFCDSVSSSNVLLPSQVQEFTKLEQSGEGILEGQVLEEALRNFSTLMDDKVTAATIRENVSKLNKDLGECQKKRHLLIHRRDLLNIYYSGLGHRLSGLTGVESHAKQQHQLVLQQLEADNTEMTESLESLMQSVTKIHTLYEQPMESQETHFLSQVNLQDYSDVEDKFSYELKMFTKKRFFDGVADMAGQSEVSKYELLEVSEPECLMVRGEKQEVILQDSRELARLKAIYPLSQTQLIEADISENQVTAAVNHLQKIIQQIHAGDFPLDINKLRDNLQDIQVSKNAVKRDLLQLQQTDIPALINRSADLQGTNIITGDYKLKLARQGYFTSNQDQLIEQLVVQRARNEFLTMAYEVEARNHRDTHRLLTAIRKTLLQIVTDWHERQISMEDPSITPARHQRATIDSRDKSTARLHQILTGGDETGDKQLFLVYSGMLKGAEWLDSQHRTAHKDLATSIEKHEDKAHMLEEEMLVCTDQLYHGSSTISGEPILTPPMLQQTATQLDTMLAKLETSIMDVIKDRQAKKKLLKANPLQSKERDLFTFFNARPAKLKQTVDTLVERLQAQCVH